MNEFHFTNLTELRLWVQNNQNLFSGRVLLLLDGFMGAGKTTFTRIIAEVFGVAGVASSPTYAIHHQYKRTDFKTIDHFDLYRLESIDDLLSTGIEDLFLQESGLIIVEWANLVDPRFWPNAWTLLQIEIRVNSDGARTLTYSVRP